LSTTAASIAGTLAVTGNATFDTNTLFVDAANNRVGVGTASPSSRFHISAASPIFQITDTNKNTNNSLHISAVSQTAWGIGTDTSGTFTGTKLTITDAGNVGIGTTAPPSKLSVFAGNDTYGLQINTNVASAATTRLSIGSFGTAGAAGSGGSIAVGAVHNHSGSAQSAMTFYTHDGSNLNEVGRFLATGGLTFNGDTAAANALDDYEEGTWTMGVAFGGASVGVTYANTTGTYTKIGRQVTVNGFVRLTNKGSSTGSAKITGLPFTVGNSTGNLAGAALRFDTITFANQFMGHAEDNTTTIALEEITLLGATSALTNADFADSCSIIVGLTYFV
jgi:hypothetical protein